MNFSVPTLGQLASLMDLPMRMPISFSLYDTIAEDKTKLRHSGGERSH
jgi:hypothetical protein